MVAARTVGGRTPGRNAQAGSGPAAALRRELERVRLERDNFQQEMFEADRQAAWLAQERQRLIDQASLPDPAAAGVAAQVEARDRYIGELESFMWQAESARHRLASYVEEIERWMWARETERTRIDAEREGLATELAKAAKPAGWRR